MQNKVAMIGAVGIDTNIYLYGREVDFSVEMNFSQNRDYIGQAGGYGAKLFCSLGYETKCIAAIGEDYHGKWIREEFTSSGIESLWISDPQGTHRSINLMYPDGRRKNFYDAKGSMEIVPDEKACERFLAGVRLAHFSIENWCRFLLPIAKRLGIIVSVDIQDVVDPQDPYRRDFVEAADILFFSAANHPNPESLLRMYDNNGTRTVVCGMGSRGVMMSYQGKVERFPAVEWFSPVVDTNGAGDALAVGFCHAHLLRGEDAETAVWKAQLLAKYVCTLRATTEGFLTADQVEEVFFQWNSSGRPVCKV